MTNLSIVEVDYGIANNFGTHIEMNRHLKDYPTLYNPILKHELSHTDKIFSLEDMKLDFLQGSQVNNWELTKFMFQHPKSFTQLLPFYWTRKKGFVYDINMTVMYLIMFSIVSLSVIGGMYL